MNKRIALYITICILALIIGIAGGVMVYNVGQAPDIMQTVEAEMIQTMEAGQ